MSEVRCPRCNSENYECYDSSNNMYGLYREHCYCEDCGIQFKVEYEMVKIEEE